MIRVETGLNTPRGVFSVTVVKTGAGAENAYIDTAGLFRQGVNNNGLAFQAQQSAVVIEQTLSDPKLATTPPLRSGVAWAALGTAAVDAVTTFPDAMPTALRLKFTGPAILQIASR